jgi:hypothetical protein
MRGRRQVALQTKAKKYCSQTSQSFVALQSKPVKDPLPRSRTAKTRCGHFALPIEDLLINRTQWKAQ